MSGRRTKSYPGKHFAMTMLLVLAFLILLLLSMYRHVSSVPHSGPLPNQQLQR
ncbi:MAG TPA: hypothetical protein VFW31_10065 [Candidatus Angelobacter sp.]|nr:hypothetical protein [Candidatus Angelobacter sp.]